MIEKNKYSNKEVVIFNGVIRLIKGGDNLYTMTVSDIAKSAEIGKGTIYDYFDSKDETITKALIYYIESELEASFIKILDKDNFKEKYYEILDIIKKGYKSNMFIISSILSSSEFEQVYQHLSEKNCIGKYIFESINEILIHLLGFAKGENIIKDGEDIYYFLMAVRGSLSTFSHYILKREYYNEIDIKKAMDTSYKILLKSLR